MPLTFLMLLIPGAGAPAVRSIRILSIQSIGGGTPPIKSIKSIKCVKRDISGSFFGLKGMLRYV